MSRTVLVTGGSGFIGSYIIRVLAERGDGVINFDVRKPSPEAAWWLRPVEGRFHFIEGSMEDWPEVVAALRAKPVDDIIHAATISNPPLLHRRPSLALHVNLQGTFNILAGARLFGIRRVVNFSSIGVLPSIQYEPVDVNHPVLLATEGPGSSFYGAAKIAGEAFCWAYRQAFGIDFITLRPSAVYGVGMQWPIFIKPMVENAVRGLPSRFEKGRDFPRDYTHVSDVAQLAVKALDIPAGDVRDRVFYGATGRPLVTAGQVAGIVKDLIPGANIEIGPGLSEDDLLEIRYRRQLSIRNAQEQLGYKPSFADIREGIKEYIETYRTFLRETQRQDGGRA